MKENPKVAVVIPYFNGSRFIERALLSVLAQSVAPSEIIIVDDGSNPEEEHFLKELAITRPFRLIRKENGGQGSARNRGVSECSAEFICFLDQDDFFLIDHIEVLAREIPLRDPMFGFVYADLKIADGDGHMMQTYFLEDHSRENPKRSLREMLRYDMYVLPSATLISRSALLAIGGFDEQFTGYEDDDLFLRIIRAGFSNYFLNRPVTMWCIHSDSTSFSIKMSRSRLRYFGKLAAEFGDTHHEGEFYIRDCLEPRFSSAFISDTIREINQRGENVAEISRILRDYSSQIRASAQLRLHREARLLLVTFVLTSCPRWVFRTLRLARWLPLVRRLAA